MTHLTYVTTQGTFRDTTRPQGGNAQRPTDGSFEEQGAGASQVTKSKQMLQEHNICNVNKASMASSWPDPRQEHHEQPTDVAESPRGSQGRGWSWNLWQELTTKGTARFCDRCSRFVTGCGGCVWCVPVLLAFCACLSNFDLGFELK